MVKLVAAIIVLSAAAWTQQPPAALPASNAQSGQTMEPRNGSSAAVQLRSDLNEMESLLNNMASEVTFQRDQNLQILLNTNIRMWTILIRDLRKLADEGEQRRAVAPKAPSGENRAKPKEPAR